MDLHEDDQAQQDPVWARRIELYSVLLIALSAIVVAWSAFEASKWGGEMSLKFSQASAARTESVREGDVANRYTVVDVGLLTNYVGAFARDDVELANFYLSRFPDRLAVAAEAWLATDPFNDPTAPASPFDMEEYVLAPAERAVELQQRADELAAEAGEANQRSDNYTITSVFLATVLLLAALSTKVGSVRLQRSLLIGATILFVATAAVIATLPVEI